MTARKKKKSLGFGTSKIGEVRATTKQLVKALGYPTKCNDHIPGGWYRQTLYEWQLKTPVGPITIYDFKEWDDPDFAEDKVITWHVGGRKDSFAARQIHPVNQWLADAIGVDVLDTRNALRHVMATAGLELKP